MNWTDRWAAPHRARPTSEFRKFGFTMAIAIAVIGGVLLLRHRPRGVYFEWISAAFVVTALFLPRLLVPVEMVWMAFAERLGRISTFIILTLAFYIVVTPLGLIRRAFSKDSMGLRPDPSAKSYWSAVEPNGPSTRPDKPF